MRFLKKGAFSKIQILDTPCFIDTETSWNHDNENPQAWITSIQVSFNGKEYFYRKPSELMEFLNKQINTYNLNSYRRMCIIIHNQSYDISYLLPYIQAYLPYKDEHNALLLDGHKIVNYRQGGLDFRCSYLLTLKSLEKLGEEHNVEHKKKVGLYDYDKIHFQNDVLSDNEKTYAIYDVISLSECFLKQLQIHDDTTASVPLTHTGYIRRKLRSSCRKDKYYRNTYFTKTKLNSEQYKFCNLSYSGGYTHNNRFLREQIITPEQFGYKYIKHRDFRSHYPSQMRTYMLPLGKCTTYFDIEDKNSVMMSPDISFDEILALSPNFYTITKIAINKMQLKDKKITMPIMQESKIFYREPEDSKMFRVWSDNGRVLQIDPKSENVFFETYVSNYTLSILREQYHIEGYIMKVYRWLNKPIPECMANVIDELFKAKSDLKYKVKECEEKFGMFASPTYDAKSELSLAKSLLNAIYGCCCMNPVRVEYDIDFDLSEPIFLKKFIKTDEDIQESLDKYYSSRNNFLPYQMGCAITDMAKYELFEFIKVIGYDNVIYVDTDSIFYLSNDEIEKKVEELNKKKNTTAPYVIDAKGNRIYYDVFEDEPNPLAFKGLHSKCYGIVTKNKNNEDELQVTIAGVPSRTIIDMKDDKPVYLTREEELAGITAEMKRNNPDIKIDNAFEALNNLEDGMTFYTNTGTTCKYTSHKPEIIFVDGHRIETAGGAIIEKLESKVVKNMDLDETTDFDFEEYNLS